MNKARGAAFSVGLTGGIGCGKSTVADLFAELGASIVDTDVIAHALTAPHGAAMPAIVAEFGPDFATPDGALDRGQRHAQKQSSDLLFHVIALLFVWFLGIRMCKGSLGYLLTSAQAASAVVK